MNRWFWLPVLIWPAAGLADAAVRTMDASTGRFWFTLAAVQVLSLLGYGTSSLPQWAGWVDETGGIVAVLERRLKIIQGMLIAFLAGNIAYYGGYYYFTLAEIACFGAASIAAYGGDKFLTPLLSRITGKVSG